MRSPRGNALILVIIVLAALVAIAAPFALSMRLQERSWFSLAARPGPNCGSEEAVSRFNCRVFTPRTNPAMAVWQTRQSLRLG